MEDLKKSESVMEDWRNYLRINGKAADILFEIIEKGIMVAASHYPMEFRIQREKIAKTLFSLNCCDDVEEENFTGCKENMKMNDDPNVNNHHHWDPINYSTSSHEETEMEVLRIKEVLDTDRDESESESAVIYYLLSKLQHMGLSYNTLEATKIGRSVSRFKKHGSTDVRLIARSLIKMWTAVADEWMEKQEDEEKEESIIKAKAAAEKKQMNSTCTGIINKESSTTSRTNVIKIKIINRNSDNKAANMEAKTSSINNIEKKLEATKRKLHQRYEEVENAKRQRKIQVVELHQLPKAINQNRKSLKMW